MTMIEKMALNTLQYDDSEGLSKTLNVILFDKLIKLSELIFLAVFLINTIVEFLLRMYKHLQSSITDGRSEIYLFFVNVEKNIFEISIVI